MLVNGGTAAASGAVTLTLATALVSVNSVTSVAGQNLVLALGTGGTALTLTTSTLAATFAGVLTASNTGTHTFGTTNTVTLTAGSATLTSQAVAPELAILAYNDTAFPIIAGFRARGTIASPTAVLQNDSFLQLGGSGYDGAAFPAANASEIWFDAADNWAPGSHPSLIRFFTTAQSSVATDHRQVMVLHANGCVGIGEGANAEGATARVMIKHAAQADLTLIESVTGYSTSLIQQAAASYISTTHDPLIFEIAGSERGRMTETGHFVWGGADVTNVAVAFQGTPTLTSASGFKSGLSIGHTITAAISDDIYGQLLNSSPAGASSSFITAASGTHAAFYGTAILPPTITNNGATVTTAATVAISGAPTGAATNKYALYVVAGASRFGGDLSMSGNLTVSGTGTSTFAGPLTLNNAALAMPFVTNGISSGTDGGASVNVQNGGVAVISLGNQSNVIGGAYSAVPMVYFAGASLRLYSALAAADAFTLSSGGNGVFTGNLTVNGTGTQSFFGSIGVAVTAGVATVPIVLANNYVAGAATTQLVMGTRTVAAGLAGTEGVGLYATHDFSANVGAGWKLTTRTTGGTEQDALTIANTRDATFASNLTVNGGNVGVGTAASASNALDISSTGLTGTTAFGLLARPTFPSSATTSGYAAYARLITAAAAFTMVNGFGLAVESPTIGAGSAVTTLTGLYVANQGTASVTNAYGIDIAAQSGAATTNIGLRNAGTTLLTQGLGYGVTSTATAAGTTTLTSSSTSVQIFTGSTTQTVQLPAASLFGAGVAVVYTIKNRSTGALTVARAGSDTIDGATSYNLPGGSGGLFNSITLMSNGSNEWEIC